MPIEILEDDTVARSLFDPKDVQLNIATSLLPLKRGNLTFQSTNDNCESVNCLRLLPLNHVPADTPIEDMCHWLGLAKCEADNQRINSENLARGTAKSPRTYAGYVTANVNDLRSASDEFVEVSVYHMEENGNRAHCNLQLIVADANGKNPTKLKNAKIAIIEGLFRGEVKYAQG